MVLILALIIYLSESLAFSVVLLSSVVASSQFATGTLWNCMSQQLHWWPDLHESALWNNILPLNVWMWVSASTIWLLLVSEMWIIGCKTVSSTCVFYLWLTSVSSQSDFFLLIIIICGICSSYPKAWRPWHCCLHSGSSECIQCVFWSRVWKWEAAKWKDNKMWNVWVNFKTIPIFALCFHYHNLQRCLSCSFCSDPG